MARDPKRPGPIGLGAQLRQLRELKELSLREVASRAGVNHGYLSQLERGEVAQPAPAILQKLAGGYDEPFVVLMRWAGYVESEDQALSSNQARALSYLGDDISDDELEAVRAVLTAIRKKRATFPALASLDGELSATDIRLIRTHMVALLRRADALGELPTPLEQVMRVADLVAAGEVTLDLDEQRTLRTTFGSLVDRVLDRLQGAIHFRAREVWVRPDLYDLRKRFVVSHEIGHGTLPWHRDVFAYLDDAERLRPDVQVLFERQANQAAIELLAQGDRLRQEADDSRLTGSLAQQLSDRYAISLQAISRRLVEETTQQCALVVRFRGTSGRLGPYHLYCSKSFDRAFGWKVAGLPLEVRQTLRSAAARDFEPLTLLDNGERFMTIEMDALDTSRSLLVFCRAASSRRTRRVLRVG